MPQADATSLGATAILAILNADTAVRSLCARTTECAIAFGDFVLGRDTLPVLLLEDTDETESDIIGDRKVSFVLAVIASGPDADDLAGQLLDAAEKAITNATLQAQGINAGLDPGSMPFPRDRAELTDPGYDYLVQRAMALALLITPE